MMRLVIDMQGAQASSRNRGIGRYTLNLARALVANRGPHEVVLAVNGVFSDSAEAIRNEFLGVLSAHGIRVWFPPTPCSAHDKKNDSRRLAAEKLYEAFLASLRPDVILVSSIFEWMLDDAVTSVGAFYRDSPIATVLYDLIPLIYRDTYLADRAVERWYQGKLEHLRRVDALLAISASSADEAIVHLGFPRSRVINISTGCDAHFYPRELKPGRRNDLMRQYGLARPFVMYTGSIDRRKNVEGLIRAYAGLPPALRNAHQLAVVCAVPERDRERLLRVARRHGLGKDELVLTGFVPDTDLVDLYNACKLFVFPSWHEGFGLPALEAMACGRAVIGANASSVPEVIGREDALFDPHDDAAMTAKMAQVLCDDAFRKELECHGLQRARLFTWDETAHRAWRALENLSGERRHLVVAPVRRLRLAYVDLGAFAKCQSASYDQGLLHELASQYEVVLVTHESVEQLAARHPRVGASRGVGWFRSHAQEFDRVLYHVRNVPFDNDLLWLMEDIPGVVVLHDFFLSAIYALNAEERTITPALAKALLLSHGWPAVKACLETIDNGYWSHYPCNLSVIQSALGVIVHADAERQLAVIWYGAGSADDWAVLPHESRGGGTAQSPATTCEDEALYVQRGAAYFKIIELFYSRPEASARVALATNVASAKKNSLLRTVLDTLAVQTINSLQGKKHLGWLRWSTKRLYEMIFGVAFPARHLNPVNSIASALCRTFPTVPRLPQLLIDVSELVQRDAKTGIQRVVRALLERLLEDPPTGMRVEPVYAVEKRPGYRYARRFTCRFLNLSSDWVQDEPVIAYEGDVFLALDFHPRVVPAQSNIYQQWRACGVKTYAVVYDLLPLQLPHAFVNGAASAHQQWLEVISRFDGAIAISRAVADELVDWFDIHGDKSGRSSYDVHYFHLGADIESSVPTKGYSKKSAKLLDRLKQMPAFLMVGTLEPRKGHSLVLSAMDVLWSEGVDVDLIIVGKQGWLVDDLIKRIRTHEQAGRRLHWLNSVSDECLDQLYRQSSALIMASEGEGFGLPLIEAARHGLPILARDIPVFREVAGEYAAYFKRDCTAQELAGVLRDWLMRYHRAEHESSIGMPWLTWSKSAEQLKDILRGAAPYRRWARGDQAWKHRNSNYAVPENAGTQCTVSMS